MYFNKCTWVYNILSSILYLYYFMYVYFNQMLYLNHIWVFNIATDDVHLNWRNVWLSNQYFD
jgi:hypothetical protein